jgi:hypothetical protein
LCCSRLSIATALFRRLPPAEGHHVHLPHTLYEQLRGSSSLSGLSATDVSKTRIRADGSETEFIRSQAVTGNLFSVLGVSASLGRTLLPEDDQISSQERVAVISYSFFQRRFGADPGVVGKTITLEDKALTIVGALTGFYPG